MGLLARVFVTLCLAAMALEAPAQPAASTLPATTPLPQDVEQALRQTLTTPTDQQLVAAQQGVVSALEALDRHLASLPNSVSLRRELGLDRLVAELARKAQRLEVLENVFHRLRSRRWQVPESEATALRDALFRFEALLRRSSVGRAELDQAMGRFERRWSEQAQQPDAARFDALSQAYTELARLGAAAEFLHWVEARASQPNHYVYIAKPWLEQAMVRNVDQQRDVSTTSQGARIQGRVTGSGRFWVTFPERADDCELLVHFSGQAREQLRVHQRLASVPVTGATTLTGRQSYLLSEEALAQNTPTTHVDQRLALGRVQLKLSPCLSRVLQPLGQRIAGRKVAEQTPRLRREANNTLQKQLDLESRSIVLQLNRLTQMLVWQPLDDLEVRQRPRFQSTAHEVLIASRYVTPWQLAAPGAPPPLPREKFAVVSQLHESAFQNTADALAGRRLGETGLHEALFDTLGLESSLVKPDDKPRVPATLWLSDRAPLQAQLRDGQVLLNVHFQSYEVDERRVDADFAVYATYALTIRDDRARADRQQIRVDSPDSAHAKPLGDLVDRFFPVYLASRAPHDNGNGGNGLGLRLTHLTVDDGWLNLGWEGTTPTSVATSPMR